MRVCACVRMRVLLLLLLNNVVLLLYRGKTESYQGLGCDNKNLFFVNTSTKSVDIWKIAQKRVILPIWKN